MEPKRKPIRIAHIIGKWVGGGVEAVVMNYYRNIDRDQIQFDFLCDSDSKNIPYEEIEALGGSVILIPPYQKVAKYHKELKKVLKEGKYKIVHSHINTLSVFSLFAAKCAKVPVRIAHSHSTTNPKEKKKNLMKQFLRPFSKVFATHYMCCSELAGRWLFGDSVYNKGKVYLLHNAIDLSEFKYEETIRKEIREELNLEEETMAIGHIGRFEEQKNHSFLIDIFYELQQQKENSILLLVGQGPKRKEIQEKVKQLGLEEKVKFLGQRKDVNRLYQAFDRFVFPSIYEGLGMVLIEAQCSNLYCLASSEVPYIAKINENVEFLELSKSAKEWANKLIGDKNKLKRGEFNEKIQEAGYDIKKEENKLVKKYLELLK
jgi:glycosyltransferase EpsF